MALVTGPKGRQWAVFLVVKKISPHHEPQLGERAGAGEFTEVPGQALAELQPFLKEGFFLPLTFPGPSLDLA